MFILQKGDNGFGHGWTRKTGNARLLRKKGRKTAILRKNRNPPI
jgi:hypothetical protein